MANAPQADIELVFPSPPLEQPRSYRPVKNPDSSGPSMRIRLSRHKKSIEIARHVYGNGDHRQGEWTKKVIPFDSDLDDKRRTGDAKSSEDEDEDGVAEAMRFLRICEVLEGLDSDGSRQPSFSPQLGSTTQCSTSKLQPVSPPPDPYPSSTPAFSIQVPPRPSRHRRRSTPSNMPQEPTSHRRSSPSLTNLTTTSLPTRFLPSIGWCVRYPSHISQGGRYRVMFLDGATLDVDVDEEWVVCKGDGGVTQYVPFHIFIWYAYMY
jgi:polo-like kinase 4